MFELYPHQTRVIDDLRNGFRQGHKRQVLGLATGGGKTVVAAHIAKSAVERGKKMLFVVDRIELVGQAVRTFAALGLRVGILQGDNTDYSRDDDIIVASIQTIRARSAPDWVDIVVVDEVHILHQTHVDLMSAWNAVPFIGLSATPLRKGLGTHFTNLVRGPSIRELTESGFLVPVRAFAPQAQAVAQAIASVRCKTTPEGFDYAPAELAGAMNRKELVGDIVSTWQALGENRPTLLFAVDIAHSKSCEAEFAAAGVSIAHIDAYTDATERRRLIDGFRAGEPRILTSVNVLSIGFDVPDAACLILARPTLSEALHIQQMGRGIRTAPGKRDCVVLDHSGNTLKHGLAEHFEVPDLDDGTGPDRAKAKRKETEPFAACGECGAVMPRAALTCPSCGLDRPRKTSKVVYRDGALVEFGAAVESQGEGSGEDRKAFYRGALGYLLARGRKPGAAYFLTMEKYPGFKPPFAWRDLEPLEPPLDQVRWIQKRQAHKAIKRQYARQPS